jgi:sugar lactone lactonase YvrE
VVDHRQELSKQMEDVEVTCDVIRQTLSEQTIDQQNHPLIQKINQWESESIKKIRQTAEESRQLLLKHTNGRINKIEVELNKLTDQLRQSRQENDYCETDLRQWKNNLIRLEEELRIKSSKITLRQDSSPFVAKIRVDALGKFIRYAQIDFIYNTNFYFLVPQLSIPYMENNRKWVQNGVTIAGGKESGNKVSQLYNPVSMYVDDADQSVYIADHWNNRIIQWKRDAMTGQIVVGGMIQNNRTDQLNRPGDVIIDRKNDSLLICDTGNRQVVQWPRRNGIRGKTIISDIDCWGLAMDNSGYLYVSDCKKHEVRRWRIGDTNGTVVAGGNELGNRLDQLNYPTHIFVDHEQSVYVSDRFNHRVMKWKLGGKEGIIVAGNQTEGNSMTQLSYPTGIVVDQLGTVYVVDSNNHRVMRWPKEATKGSVVVGGNGHGQQSNQLYNPWGISFDKEGDMYIADSANHRIQKFTLNTS